MSVSPRYRVFLFAAALLTAAQALFAGAPSARTQARMVFDPTTSNVILFGGQSAFDKGTAKTYDIGETWLWNGSRWVQHYSTVSPPARSTHAMVWDSNRSRVVLFGGKQGTTELNDTWVYRNGEWSSVDTPNAPSKRQLPGAAFDPLRDRVVLYGGSATSADGKSVNGIFDTWEFDGTTWTQIGGTGPTVFKPILAYDEAHQQIVMLGVNDKSETLMYIYNGANGTWTQKTPAALPTCVNEGTLFFNDVTRKLMHVGGICANEGVDEQTWEWDGETWTKITPLLTAIDRAQGQAVTFDERRGLPFMFGGTTISFTEPRSDAFYFATTDWVKVTDTFDPAARSIFGFRRDSVNNVIWLIGGQNDFDMFNDLWKYQFGQWTQVVAENGPVGCNTPVSAFDSDRAKLVVVCASTSETWEWDGSAWKSFTGLKTFPVGRRFASMAYDQTLKKTVFFGGFEADYRNDTWTWDGTAWTEVKKNKATQRAQASMWYDPIMKKTLLYGGVGRPKSDEAVVRFDDMYSFDGTGWKKMTITATPGKRYGAQLAVDPISGKTLLFGGMIFEQVDVKTQRQFYGNDTWEWDGSAWKKLEPSAVAPARENAGMEFDPSTNQIVMFAGWSGFFLSDVWAFDGQKWVVRPETATRRRAGGQFARPTPPEPPLAIKP